MKLPEDKVTDESVRKLFHVATKLTANPKKQAPAPVILAFVVGTRNRAYQRSDGIFVIPAATLGP